jgi:hypothetical protein
VGEGLSTRACIIEAHNAFGVVLHPLNPLGHHQEISSGGLYRMPLSQANFDDSGKAQSAIRSLIFCHAGIAKRNDASILAWAVCPHADDRTCRFLIEREGRAIAHRQKLLADQSLLINERHLSTSLLGEAEAPLQGFAS